jgi:hypothetical protein
MLSNPLPHRRAEQRGRVDVERKKVPNRIGILGPLRLLVLGGTRFLGRCAIQRRFKVSGEVVDLCRRRPWHAGRRHHAHAQFPNDFLPRFGALWEVGEVGMFERQATRAARVAVTGDAVLIQDGRMRGIVGVRGPLRASCCRWADPDGGNQKCQTRRHCPSIHQRPPEPR